MSARTFPAGLVLVGEQKIALTGTAVVAVNSTVRPASKIIFSVETATVRMKFGSTIPAATTGVLFIAGNYELDGPSGSSTWKFTAVSGSPVVNIAGFKYAGEP